MRSLDTNVLARFFVDDADDDELPAKDVSRVLRALSGLEQVTIED